MLALASTPAAAQTQARTRAVGFGTVPGTPYACGGITWTVELGTPRRRRRG